MGDKVKRNENLLDLAMNVIEKDNFNKIFEAKNKGSKFILQSLLEQDESKSIDILFSYLQTLDSDSCRIFTALYVFFTGKYNHIRIQESVEEKFQFGLKYRFFKKEQ